MECYKKILVPLDGSERLEAVLPAIEKVPAAFKASLCFLSAVYVQPIPYEHLAKLQMAAFREADGYLHRIERQLKANGFKVESHVQYGSEWEKFDLPNA